LIDPRKLVYSHLPLDKKWQLLDHPFSHSDWEKQLCVSPEFLSWGINVTAPKEDSVRAANQIVVKFNGPVGMALLARLKIRGGKECDPRSCLCHTDASGYVVEAVFGRTGGYILSVFGSLPSTGSTLAHLFELNIHSRANERLRVFPRTYPSVCEYGVSIQLPKEGRLSPTSCQQFLVTSTVLSEVFVVSGRARTNLSKTGQVFSGTVCLLPGAVQLCGNVGGEQATVLAEYECGR